MPYGEEVYPSSSLLVVIEVARLQFWRMPSVREQMVVAFFVVVVLAMLLGTVVLLEVDLRLRR